jgi:hypothetical protein
MNAIPEASPVAGDDRRLAAGNRQSARPQGTRRAKGAGRRPSPHGPRRYGPGRIRTSGRRIMSGRGGALLGSGWLRYAELRRVRWG